jgi:hypothetical protein
MNTYRVVLMTLFCAGVLWCSNAYAETEENIAFTSLTGSRSLKCTYTLASNTRWKGRGVQVKSVNEGMIVSFDSINYEHRTATVRRNQLTSDVQVLPTASGISFLELTPSGSVIITTVFPAFADDEKFTAVMSRHVLMMGDPVPSQWHGTCKSGE